MIANRPRYLCKTFFAAALFAAVIVIILGTTSCEVPSQSQTAASGAVSPEVQEQEVDLDELAQSLPYAGLSEKYIGESWLGYPGKVEKPQDGVAYYTWYSKNGRRDEVFFAACGGGVVVGTAKINIADYWPDYNGLPDLYANENAPSTARGDEASSKKSDDGVDGSKSNKYNPRDYDSAEDWEADTGGSIEEWDRQ